MMRSREFTKDGQTIARFVERTGFDLAKNQSKNVLKILGGYTLVLKTAADIKRHIPADAVAGAWAIDKA